jgi:hypothetical protein
MGGDGAAVQGKNGPAHGRTFIVDGVPVPVGTFIRNYKLHAVRALTPEVSCKEV